MRYKRRRIASKTKFNKKLFFTFTIISIFINTRIVSSKDTTDIPLRRPVVAQVAFSTPEPILTPPTIDEYIVEVFSDRPEEALATFKHENGYQLRNGWDPEHLTYNTNGTGDVGIAKINSIHWERCGGLEALKDPYKNIDCARVLYLERESITGDGLGAWYSYVFKKHLMFM